MNLLVAISILFALLTLYFLRGTARSIRKARPLRATASGVSCLLTGAATGAGAIILLGYLSYSRLVDEQLVSRIEFDQKSPGEFRARLMIAGTADQFFILRGDEWQIDAKIVTWKPPLTILGLAPIYKLDRLSGRYTDISREKSEPRTIHSLAQTTPTDVWQIAQRFPLLLPGVDAHYGTATYVPMADGARFNVSLTRNALIARPANTVARDAVGTWSE